MKYFISSALKYQDPQMAPVTHYGNLNINLPHKITDDSDIADLQALLAEKNKGFNVIILWFQEM